MPFYSSLTRNSNLATEPYQVQSLDPGLWARGDFVLTQVEGEPSPLYQIEISNGRMVPVMAGDEVVGAFGHREATLEGVGTWRAIEDGRMHALTSAGLLGRLTSKSKLVPKLMDLRYRGHIMRNGNKVNMSDFVPESPEIPLNMPVIALVGTSMSAGKTTAGRVIIHELKKMGQTVVGAKLTGAGRYRDTLLFRDAGADHIFDFVDIGLPSTVIEREEFRPLLKNLLSRIALTNADVLVAEAGASPMEPYNGAECIFQLGRNIKFRVLCASDPYAVVGVKAAFGFDPDLVAGPATSTRAAIDLVEKLAGGPALNVLDSESYSLVAKHLRQALQL